MGVSSSDEISRPSTPSHGSTAPSTPPEQPEYHSEHFTRWRPNYHLQPSSGWMNDPCAPGYDPTTGLYHVSFQWNPNGCDWGDIAWGSATSSDMISWTVREDPVLSPDMPYDCKGVFTGCLVPTRDACLTFAYTSVSALPIHYTIPHQRGSESLSLARSFDNGRTWQKSARNPVLPAEPPDVDVTGWRDPFCAPWPTVAGLLDLDPEKVIFGIISGGIRSVTPTPFLYMIDVEDVENWTYIGPLVNAGLNACPSRWSGDLGTNWEVTNFVTLTDEDDSSVRRDFLIMGTEGCLPHSRPAHAQVTGAAAVGPRRPCREQLWMSGRLREGRRTGVSGAVEMSYEFGGRLDHGCLYAANSFFDPHRQKQLVWGWIPEDDVGDALRHRQGWSGMLSMPRELFMQTQRHVVHGLVSPLSSITSLEIEDNESGSFTVRTLASQPYKPLIQALRCGPRVRHALLSRSRVDHGAHPVRFTADQVRSKQWELDCVFRVSRQCRTVGVSIAHSEDESRSTTLVFDPPSETFTIIRPPFPDRKSSELINSAPEVAPHTLFLSCAPMATNEVVEPLHIQAWRDNSVLEVFINGRTVVSTRIYAAEETFGMRFFADDDSEPISGSESLHASGSTELLKAELWDDISVS